MLLAATPPMVGCAVVAEERALVHGLEGQLLALLGEHALDLRKRRAGARRDDELARLIERDTREARGGQRRFTLGRSAEARLAAAARDGERRRDAPLRR